MHLGGLGLIRTSSVVKSNFGNLGGGYQSLYILVVRCMYVVFGVAAWQERKHHQLWAEFRCPPMRVFCGSNVPESLLIRDADSRKEKVQVISVIVQRET